MLSATLREHEDGDLYVVESDVQYNEPVRVEVWWPLALNTANFKRNYGAASIGQTMVYQGGGVYVGSDKLQYRLVDGAQTRARYTETVAIAPPKAKQETRWRNGRWEKLLRKGWVAA